MQGYTRAVFADLCRLCASNRNGGNVDIFGEEGQIMRLQDKMQSLVNIKVSNMDHLPKVICHICSSKLEELHSFWNACQSSELMLNNFYNRAKNFDYFKNTGMVYIENNMFNSSQIEDISKKNDYIIVPQPDKSSTSTNVANISNIANVTNISNVSNITTTLNSNNECIVPISQDNVNVCNLKIIISQPQNQQQSLASNKPTHETVKILKIDTLPAKKPLTSVSQPQILNHFIAPNKLVNNNQLRQVQLKQEQPEHFVINLEEDEEQEVNVKMEPPNPFTIQQTRQLQQQNSQPNPLLKTRQYGCQQCGMVFHRREHLFQHNKVHSGLRPYKCEHCSKTFVRKEHLMRHETCHTGRKDHTCDLCSRSFSRKDNLHKHRKIHEKDMSYVCGICRKTFVLKYYFDQHMETAHSAEETGGVRVKLEDMGGNMLALKLG